MYMYMFFKTRLQEYIVHVHAQKNEQLILYMYSMGPKMMEQWMQVLPYMY